MNVTLAHVVIVIIWVYVIHSLVGTYRDVYVGCTIHAHLGVFMLWLPVMHAQVELINVFVYIFNNYVGLIIVCVYVMYTHLAAQPGICASNAYTCMFKYDFIFMG